MKIEVLDKEKTVEIWLTNAEKASPAIQAELKTLYAEYKPKKYMVAVYESGRGDLFDDTLALLQYNKRRSAERIVQQEKRRHAAGMEQ